MPKVLYRVTLTEEERTQLRELLKRGKRSARALTRARILLKADEGLSDPAIAEALDVGTTTVFRIRQRCVEEGLEASLSERPRPGQKRKLDGKQEAHLIAVACSEAPEGHTHWTLRLLAGKAVELGFVESICPETIRQTLKKTTSSRGERSPGASRR